MNQLLILLLCSIANHASAASFSDVANNLVAALDNMSSLIIALSYVCGIGYTISALMKFKNHKDNPQQMPISTPVTELFMAIALLCLPTIAKFSGISIFDEQTRTNQAPKSTLEQNGHVTRPKIPANQKPYSPNQLQQIQPATPSKPKPNNNIQDTTEQPEPNSDGPYYYIPEE